MNMEKGRKAETNEPCDRNQWIKEQDCLNQPGAKSVWAASDVNVGTRLPRGIEFRVTPYLGLRAWKLGFLRAV